MEVIKDYKNGYKVSSYGYIINPYGKKLKSNTVKIYGQDGPTENVRRVVASVFFGELEHQNVVYNIDGNIKNNNILNLQVWKNIAALNSWLMLSGVTSPLITDFSKEKYSKITKKQAIKIRKIIDEGNLSQTDLAKKYNVSRRTIYRVANNKSWN